MKTTSFAGSTRLTASLLVTALVLAGCRSDGGGGGTASSISFVGGTNQQAPVGTGVLTAPQVRVLDNTGTGVSGVTIRFSVVQGGGTLIGDSVVTDGSGRASVGEWILGTSPGPNALKAAVSSSTLSTTVTATGVAGNGVSIRSNGAQGFLALVGQPVSPLPSVVVIDSYNNPVSGVDVTFAVAQGGGTITGADVTTDANGMARLGSWTLGATSGTNVVTAKITGGSTVTFTAQGLTGPPVLTATSSTSQAGFLSLAVGSIPRIQVTDASGRPLSGVPVAFAITAGDGTLTGANVVSDATGMASPTDWRIGTNGSSTVTATTGLGAAPVSFTATGVPAAFQIDVRFVSSVTPDERDAFIVAARRWMRIITGHLSTVPVTLSAGACSTLQPAMNEAVTDLVIFADVSPIDGVGNILGASSPCAERSSSGLTVVGTMSFDSADLDNLARTGQLIPTVTHEMAHVLGFGTIWSSRSLTSGTGGSDPIFIGSETLSLWAPFAAALGYSGRPLPLENQGGAGTRDSHWRESVFHAELMTGYIEAPGVAMPLSKLTIGTMKDLGYQVDYSQADLFLGALRAPDSSDLAPVPLNEKIGSASFEVSPDGLTRRIR